MQQTDPLVDCGQVVRRQVCVSPRHIQRGMSQRLLQVECAAASAKVVHGEGIGQLHPETLSRERTCRDALHGYHGVLGRSMG